MSCEASQIRSALEKMGGEGVAHHVGGERSLDSREASVSLQKLEESLAGHGPPAPAQEQTSLARLRGEERPARDQVTLDPLLRRAAVGDDALLSALSPADQVADLEVQVSRPEGNQLRHPEARGVEELQHRAVPEPFGRRSIRRLQKILDLLEGQIPRK